MKRTADNPGVFIPPPLFYVAVFLAGYFLQRMISLPIPYSDSLGIHLIAWVFITGNFLFSVPALYQFFHTGNTLVPIKPAHSLQTNGIFSITRNPMYLSLLLVYIGISILKGSLWNILLIPVLVVVVNYFVIFKEEAYLERAFGNEYLDYKKKVRRWI